MTVKLTGIVIAEGMSLDAITQRVTAFNIFDHVIAPKFPALLAKVGVIVMYERPRTETTPAGFVERLRVLSPGGNEISISGPSSILMTTRYHRSLHGIGLLRIDGPGDLELIVEHASEPTGPWTEVARAALAIVEGSHPLYSKEAPPQPPPAVREKRPATKVQRKRRASR